MSKEELTTEEKKFILRTVNHYDKYLRDGYFYSNQEIPESVKVEKTILVENIKRKLSTKTNLTHIFKR